MANNGEMAPNTAKVFANTVNENRWSIEMSEGLDIHPNAEIAQRTPPAPERTIPNQPKEKSMRNRSQSIPTVPKAKLILCFALALAFTVAVDARSRT